MTAAAALGRLGTGRRSAMTLYDSAGRGDCRRWAVTRRIRLSACQLCAAFVQGAHLWRTRTAPARRGGCPGAVILSA